mmetsp:Transcript_44891/g.94202  ORF Transcript_44891/g.94202 Transcript_44891/m.94202 type:complete len:358 (-) Transcript_44891:144-1217(-)
MWDNYFLIPSLARIQTSFLHTRTLLSFYLFLARSRSIVCLQNLQRFLNLGSERLGTLQQVEQFRIVHFQKHSRDLSCQFRLCLVDEGIETFSDHVLLHLRRGGGEGRGGELLGGRGRAGRRRGSRWLLRGNGRRALLRRGALRGHAGSRRSSAGPGVARLLVEFHRRRTSRHAASGSPSVRSGPATSLRASPSGAASHGSASSSSGLGGHHAVTLHGISRPLMSPRSLHSVTAASSPHHLRNDGIGRLHAPGPARTGHVHGHRSRVSSHRSAHGTAHHASRTSRRWRTSRKWRSDDSRPWPSRRTHGRTAAHHSRRGRGASPSHGRVSPHRSSLSGGWHASSSHSSRGRSRWSSRPA